MFTTQPHTYPKPKLVRLIDEGNGTLRLQVEGYNVLEFRADGKIRRVGSVSSDTTGLTVDSCQRVVFD